MTDKHLIGWIDLETTGLRSDSDRILEVGCIVTDQMFTELSSFHRVLGCPCIRMSPIAKAIHSQGNLLKEVKQSGYRVTQVDRQLANYLMRIRRKYATGLFILGGSGVDRFDRAFLRDQMNKTFRLFRLRSLDISAFRVFLTLRGIDIVYKRPTSKHRVMSDLYDSIEEARYYKKILKGLNHENNKPCRTNQLT